MEGGLSIFELPRSVVATPKNSETELTQRTEAPLRPSTLGSSNGIFNGPAFKDITIESTLSAESFISKGFISHETWDKVIRLDAKITSVSTEYVICDCLIDPENRVFQSRKFDVLLFNNVKPLKKDNFVKIKIMSKPGSTRIDVIDGKDLINTKVFKLEGGWNKDYSFLDKTVRHIDIK